MKRISIKGWISLFTFALVAVVIFFSRHELVRAWQLLGQVNLAILLLLIPVQIASYYGLGAMMFSYLKQKTTVNASSIEMAKMALELNFVNHVLPSGGVSGISYMTWRLGHLGISAGRATLTQVVRFAVSFGSFLILMLIAVVAITIDGSINRFTILVSSGLASTIIFGCLVVIYIIKSRQRLQIAGRFLTKYVNKFWRQVLRRDRALLHESNVVKFFEDLHSDYVELAREPKILLRPLAWGFVFTISDVALFWVTFWALGTIINPAPLLIAYGLAVVAGVFLITPGGAGGFEVLMITFLATSGIPQGTAVAAVLLARTILIIGTILSGYIFYQKALNRYGKHTS